MESCEAIRQTHVPNSHVLDCDVPATSTAATSMIGAPDKSGKKRKKRCMKMKKAPGAPRRFKTAYIFFSITKHRELREELGKRSKKEKTTNIAKMVSAAWKDLSKEERAVWESIAAKDKARYELEKSMYDGPWQIAVCDHRRDPSAPRRPCSSFVTYLNHKRDEVKKAHPSASSHEVIRIVSKIWHNSPEDRATFLDREAEERRQYKLEMQKWNEQLQKNKPEVLMATKREEMAWEVLEAQEEEEAVEQEEGGGGGDEDVEEEGRGEFGASTRQEDEHPESSAKKECDEEVKVLIPQPNVKVQCRVAKTCTPELDGQEECTKESSEDHEILIPQPEIQVQNDSSPEKERPTSKPTELVLPKSAGESDMTPSEQLSSTAGHHDITVPSLGISSFTDHDDFLFGQHSASLRSLRRAYSHALEHQYLIQRLTNNRLRAFLGRPTLANIDPIELKLLDLQLQRRRMESDWSTLLSPFNCGPVHSLI